MKSRLLDYVEGRLSEADRRQVESRIERDPLWRQQYEELRQGMDWLQKQPRPEGAPELYWSGFNARLRRRLAERVSTGRRRVIPAMAAAALVVVAVAGSWWLTPADDLTDAAIDSSWYDEPTTYGTTLDYPAAIQSDFDDLSNDEARMLLAELDDTVIL